MPYKDPEMQKAARRRYHLKMLQWVRLEREKLIRALGGKCALCGSEERLEFNHKFGRNWIAEKKNSMTRMRLYLEDYENGKLRLLCRTCNAGYNPSKEEMDVPF